MLHIDTREKNLGGLRTLESGTIHVAGLEGTRFALCHIGVIPEGEAARQVYQGPLVTGPWGFAVTHPLVIDTMGGSAREKQGAIHVSAGDEFTVEGLPGVWTFRSPDRYRYEGDGAKLERVR